jgi:hypothetical protein
MPRMMAVLPSDIRVGDRVPQTGVRSPQPVALKDCELLLVVEVAPWGIRLEGENNFRMTTEQPLWVQRSTIEELTTSLVDVLYEC